MRVFVQGIASLPLLCLAAALVAQTASLPPKTEAELDAESRQADELLRAAHGLEALPLFEDLHARRPQRPIYTEHLAACYVQKMSVAANAAEARASATHARTLFLEAQAAGDNSDFVQVMLEKANDFLASPDPVPITDAKDPRVPGGAFEQAEARFNKADFAGASTLYQQAYAEHPKFYPAPLYAGDSEYRLSHFDLAGAWYAKAIAIDPDTETAHRYWADCLMKAGKPNEARVQYIEAFIADPYSKAPRLSLKQYAGAEHLRYVAPPVTLPAPPTTGKDGHINITMNFDPTKKDDPMAPAMLMYSMNSALWQGDKFKKEFPKEKAYRHSLAEEVDSLRLLLVSVREQKIAPAKYDATIRTLMELEKDNMIECWILLDAPDQETAQDYAAYRATHHELLRAYIEKYDLHPA